jgi:hypothetical protein
MNVFRLLFLRLPFCASVGALLGSTDGLLFGVLMLNMNIAHASVPDTLLMGLETALLSFPLAFYVLVVSLRYVASAVFWPLLLNAASTGVAVVVADRVIGSSIFAAVIGALVGTLVGAILCRLCAMRAAQEGS